MEKGSKQCVWGGKYKTRKEEKCIKGKKSEGSECLIQVNRLDVVWTCP